MPETQDDEQSQQSFAGAQQYAELSQPVTETAARVVIGGREHYTKVPEGAAAQAAKYNAMPFDELPTEEQQRRLANPDAATLRGANQAALDRIVASLDALAAQDPDHDKHPHRWDYFAGLVQEHNALPWAIAEWEKASAAGPFSTYVASRIKEMGPQRPDISTIDANSPDFPIVAAEAWVRDANFAAGINEQLRNPHR